MARFDSYKTMMDSCSKNEPPKWQCENCGKIYLSYEKMVSTKCHSHPHGAWAGYCSCSVATKAFGKVYEDSRYIHSQRSKTTDSDPNSLVALSRLSGLYQKEKYVCQVKLFDFVSRMLNEWSSQEAINTRKILKRSCQDFVDDISFKHVYHEKVGVGESLVDYFRILEKKIEQQSFWIKLYCLFYEVCLSTREYDHLLTKDESLMRDWKSRKDWEWMSNWPLGIVRRFIFCCISVTQHDSAYSDEMQAMFDYVAKNNFYYWLVEEGYRSHIPKSYLKEYKELSEKDFFDRDFWFELYCFIRLELKAGSLNLANVGP